MKNLTIAVYLSTLPLTLLCFSCSQNSQQSNIKISGIPAEAIALVRDSAKAKADARDFQGCIADAQKALSIHNDYAEAHFMKGSCYYELGRVQEAISSFETASRIAQSKGRGDLARDWAFLADELKQSANNPRSKN